MNEITVRETRQRQTLLVVSLNELFGIKQTAVMYARLLNYTETDITKIVVGLADCELGLCEPLETDYVTDYLTAFTTAPVQRDVLFTLIKEVRNAITVLNHYLPRNSCELQLVDVVNDAAYIKVREVEVV